MSVECNDYEESRKQILRGHTPEDIASKCLRLCGDYLGGVWLEVNERQLIIRRITGGFTNQLYYCGLTRECEPRANEPREVAIKLYANKWFTTTGGDKDDRFNDTVIGLMASIRGIGPQKYGFFDGGYIEEYIESHTFGIKEQNDPKYMALIARKMALFHHMPVPMTRGYDWYGNYLENFYAKALELFPIDDMLREINANTLLSVDFHSEIQWLKRCLKSTDSPVVFSHNDFQGRNIMVKESVDTSLTLGDFEYSCYYYRGFDIACLFEEWGKTELTDVENSVSEETLSEFMVIYLDECIEINGEEYAKNAVNTVAHLALEAQVFLLAEYMFIIAFALRAEEIPNIFESKQHFLQNAEQRMKQYLVLKDRYIKKGLISSSL